MRFFAWRFDSATGSNYQSQLNFFIMKIDIHSIRISFENFNGDEVNLKTKDFVEASYLYDLPDGGGVWSLFFDKTDIIGYSFDAIVWSDEGYSAFHVDYIHVFDSKADLVADIEHSSTEIDFSIDAEVE